MRSVLHDMGRVIADPSLAAATQFTGDAALKAMGVAMPMLIGMMLIGVAGESGRSGCTRR